MIGRKVEVGLLALLFSVASPASALEKLPFKPEATDMHFQYMKGECAIVRVAFGGGGGPVLVESSEGCVDGLFTLRFKYNNTPGFVVIPPVYTEGDPIILKRKKVKIVDAFWTYEDSFYGPLWEDGKTRYVVVPEVSTWAMMIVGFGLVGASSRRSSKRRMRAH